jgi:signal transduction histidine kinase
MDLQKKLSVNSILGTDFWVAVVIIGVTLTVVLGAVLAHAQAFESFYEFSRRHEVLQLDDWAVAAFASLVMISLLAFTTTLVLGHRLVKAAREKIETERRLAQGQHLIAMGTLMGGVAHSINNHLTPVIALAEMLRDEFQTDSEQAQDLAKIVQAAHDASSMLNRLKTLGRSDFSFSGVCEIGTAATNAVDLARKASLSSVSFYLDIKPLTERVAMSTVALEVVVINLINNAIDAMQGRPGNVAISLDLVNSPPPTMAEHEIQNTSGAWVRLQVSDCGKGMSEVEVQRMFEPFFTTKPPGKGTGLGMSETFGIVNAAGGTFEVSSRPGKGSKIGVYLPVLSDSPAQSDLVQCPEDVTRSFTKPALNI